MNHVIDPADNRCTVCQGWAGTVPDGCQPLPAECPGPPPPTCPRCGFPPERYGCWSDDCRMLAAATGTRVARRVGDLSGVVLPPFQHGLYLFLPTSLVRITDAGTAILLAWLIVEKELAERGAYPTPGGEHPHDADRCKRELGWTASYHSGRFTAAKKLGVLTWKTVGGVRRVTLDVAAIQTKIGT